MHGFGEQLDETESLKMSNRVKAMNRANTASLVQTPENTVRWPSGRKAAKIGDLEDLDELDIDMARRVTKMALKRQQNKSRQESSQVKSILF